MFRRWLFKYHKTIFSVVDELPSWTNVYDSLESMSDLDEEGDMPDGKYFLRSGVDEATGLATVRRARKTKTKKIPMGTFDAGKEGGCRHSTGNAMTYL